MFGRQKYAALAALLLLGTASALTPVFLYTGSKADQTAASHLLTWMQGRGAFDVVTVDTTPDFSSRPDIKSYVIPKLLKSGEDGDNVEKFLKAGGQVVKFPLASEEDDDDKKSTTALASSIATALSPKTQTGFSYASLDPTAWPATLEAHTSTAVVSTSKAQALYLASTKPYLATVAVKKQGKGLVFSLGYDWSGQGTYGCGDSSGRSFGPGCDDSRAWGELLAGILDGFNN